MDSKLSRWCDGVIEAGWLAAIILTPLFFNIHSDRVFEPDKLALLRSIALLMLALWVVKLVDQRAWEGIGNRLKWRTTGSVWQMPFILPVVILIAVYLISTIFSVTPSISWAGSYQRLQGTYTTLSYIVIFLVTISTMRTSAQARRLVTAVIITSIPISFYGLLQHFDLDPLPWAGDTTRRVAGHMGNAIFVAAYLIMAVPLTLSRIIVSFNNILNDEELSAADVVRSSIYIFTLAIQLITIYWSGSRGPWLGIFVGIFAFILIILVALRNASDEETSFRPVDGGKAFLLVASGGVALFVFSLILQPVLGARLNLSSSMISFIAFVLAVGFVVLAIFTMIAAQQGWRWLWLSWIILSVVLALWLVAFNLPTETTENFEDVPVAGAMFQTLEEWKSLSTIGRLGTVLEADSGTGRVRTLIWEGVLDLIAFHEPLAFPDGSQDTFNVLRPFIGYGPEAMYVAYNRYYPPELANIEARNASPDRSHNETFDALVITGWSGFLAWQFLYISVFYYGFKWLGVLNSKRDGYLLVGFWLGFGAIVAGLFASFLGAVYLGVAFPFGSILGLIIYLIYFALFGKSPVDEASKRPFATNRMLMIALVAAILAHYVEIHFGIAIASSRTHFFLYIAIMFVIGHLLPQLQPDAQIVPAGEDVEEVKTAVKKGKKGRGRKGSSRNSSRRRVPQGLFNGPLMLSMFVLTLIVGIIGFEYTTYTVIPGREYTGPIDLPVGEVINQSFFMDAGNGFVDSPFIFVLLVLTWALGAMIIVSEMVKDGELEIEPTLTLPDQRRLMLTAVLAIMGLVGLGARIVLQPPVDSGSAFLLGRSLLAAYGAGALITAVLVYINSPSSQFIAGVLAVVGLAVAFPVLMAGGWWQALILLALNSWIFYIVRDGEWGKVLAKTAVLAVGSFGIGILYTYLHAWVFRNSLFFQPTGNIETLSEYRILEASQSAFFLTLFYLFAFGALLMFGSLSAIPKISAIRRSGETSGKIALAGLILLTLWFIPKTNLQVIQADMIFKRGRFFDNQASSNGDSDLWLSAIAIYNESIRLSPREDYYYLFLGRALLESSGVAEDPDQQVALLEQAREQLLDAQKINPLNTDHTANLARLNTRWIGFSDPNVERETLIDNAESYYIDALALSPQNSIIRNEYARLVYDLKSDCDQSIDIFEESIEIDPYYSDTYFWLVDTYVRCASALPVPTEPESLEDEAAQGAYEEAQEAYEDEQRAIFDQALQILEAGLAIDENNARAWLRASQLYTELGKPQEAIDALDMVRLLDPMQQVLANWNYDYSRAQLYVEVGDEETAVALAKNALQIAPAEFGPQMQQFIFQLSGEQVPLPEVDIPIEEEVDPAGLLSGERPLATIPPEQRNGIFPAYPEMAIDLTTAYQAIISTEKGDIKVQLFAEQAPLTVNNFVYLANQGFYDNTTFHRVISGFMAQGGDPTSTGAGGPGYQFADETNNGLIFDRPGLLAMANAGANTNGSQFFITYDIPEWLNGNHTIFGELLEGQEVLNSLTVREPGSDLPADVILKIEIIEDAP